VQGRVAWKPELDSRRSVGRLSRLSGETGVVVDWIDFGAVDTQKEVKSVGFVGSISSLSPNHALYHGIGLAT
jgi:hypothetical protein